MTGQRPGRVLWITGLSGAGKTTLATVVARRLQERGTPVVLLDGDELRVVFGEIQAHGRDARLRLAFRYAHLCRVIAAQGLTVIIATISLFREVHAWNRAHLPGYCEIFLKVPLDELRRRDTKDLYRRFDAGEIADVAGLDLDIDEPEAAHWTITPFPLQSIEDLASHLIQRIDQDEQLRFSPDTQR